MFEIFLPYFIGTAIGIEPDGSKVKGAQVEAAAAVSSAELQRAPEDQTPTGKFTTAGEIKPILGMTQGNWAAVRAYEGQDLLYLTHLLSWRCGLWTVSYAINDGEMSAFDMEPCYDDTSAPNALMVTEGYLPYVAFPLDSIETVTIEISYDDGTSDIATFDRNAILLP